MIRFSLLSILYHDQCDLACTVTAYYCYKSEFESTVVYDELMITKT